MPRLKAWVSVANVRVEIFIFCGDLGSVGWWGLMGMVGVLVYRDVSGVFVGDGRMWMRGRVAYILCIMFGYLVM